jgi:TDG/mug DNA glycosylase family protein
MPSHIIHPIPPVFDADSRILILGSFPSVKSRESCFFYGHPQNRFWKLLARLRKEDVPSSIEEKKEFLLRNHIAVWDTIHSCSIEGSSDSSIRDVVPNDLASILDHASIQTIYTNGGLSGKMYDRFCRKQTGIEAIKLPSTSPANAAWNLDRLTDHSFTFITDKNPDLKQKTLFPMATHARQQHASSKQTPSAPESYKIQFLPANDASVRSTVP